MNCENVLILLSHFEKFVDYWIRGTGPIGEEHIKVLDPILSKIITFIGLVVEPDHHSELELIKNAKVVLGGEKTVLNLKIYTPLLSFLFL